MGRTNQTISTATSRDEQEIARFSAQADAWWDPNGPFAPLHRMNPARMRILAQAASNHFDRPLGLENPFAGLTLTDVGCGGGLVTEPFARLGFTVTGLDASQENINVAKVHAAASGLTIDYRVGAPEQDLFRPHEADVVLALEVVEHVADIEVFVSGLAQRLAPGGLLVMSTINRTMKSMVLAKVAVEYVLRWVPSGTHTWRNFVRPSELSRYLRSAGMNITDIQGMVYDLATGEWHAGGDVSVNYILAATSC